MQPLDDVWVDRYLTHVRVEKRLAARTQDLYAQHLQDLLRRCAEADLDVLAVRDPHVRRWAAQLRARGHVSRGIALVLSCWRGFYTWLGRQGAVPMNPVQGVRAPKADKPLPKALGVEDALRLVSGPPATPVATSASAAEALEHEALAARDRCIAELLYSSGLRISELLGLDVRAHGGSRGWVDADAGEVHVQGKGDKWRTVPVGGAALAALRDWLPLRARWVVADGDGALFVGRQGTRLGGQAARLRLRQTAVAAGLSAPVHPHMLRHSFASHLLQSSGDLRAVQELLGHANIGTTQVYTRLDFQHLAKTYEAAHPRARRAPSKPPGSQG